ncbi:exopolysaccharide biosynthesis polyprenyl glycosylphosphotransferase [Kitasatospora sp. MAP5-34]|uniref:exopolysaccharide biosynthesis polyprenyl glycosylphosphotransferase n=1 Tax=Kitasatospora sp. MAP5-34 TaxID=3035102 RepID=UPI002473D2BD|nr:exopolysaccharide biosynthesis polyprenyl glycosylphosphotransferase [Kitasatospora sp. MAP5-34]
MAVESASYADKRRDVIAPRELRGKWQHDHLLKLIVADVMAAATASFVVYLCHGRSEVFTLLPLLWPAALLAVRAYGKRQLGYGAEDHRRIIRAALALGALSVLGSELALGPDRLVHDAVVGLAGAAVLTTALRGAMRGRLGVGEDPRRVLVVGHPDSVATLAESIEGRASRGLRLVGACFTTRPDSGKAADPKLPVLGGRDNILSAVRRTRCESVIVLPDQALDQTALRRLGWALNAEGVELLLGPMLTDVAASRLSVRTVGGVPLLHVRAPARSGTARLPKEILDRLAAAAGLLLLTPLLLVLAMLVRFSSPGPAFFQQRRVGLNGEPFTMFKFRTMLLGAESLRTELAELNLNTEGPLFKARKDPRTTALGRFLRRYSLDELPQLINVLAGHMSLVGPRPPLPEETLDYDEVTRRRLLVKPGLTGLWQVSGRSDLPWHEAVRLDLSYVDNWSHSLDALILLRTTGAVARGKGAY